MKGQSYALHGSVIGPVLTCEEVGDQILAFETPTPRYRELLEVLLITYTILTRFATSQLGREVELGVFSMIARAGLVVQLVLGILLLMSVMTWAIIFYKWRMLRQAERENHRFHNLFLHQQRLSLIHEGAESMTFSPVASIFRAGYIELVRVSRSRQQQPRNFPSEPSGLVKEAGGTENINRALSKAAETELTRLEKALPFLATTGSTAPFIGLFGTVWGIMNSFMGIGRIGGKARRGAALAAGSRFHAFRFGGKHTLPLGFPGPEGLPGQLGLLVRRPAQPARVAGTLR